MSEINAELLQSIMATKRKFTAVEGDLRRQYQLAKQFHAFSDGFIARKTASGYLFSESESQWFAVVSDSGILFVQGEFPDDIEDDFEQALAQLAMDAGLVRL